MGFNQSMQISAMAINAQRQRLEVISANIANMETTRTPEGGPYQRRLPVFQTVDLASSGQFSSALKQAMGVEVTAITKSARPPIMKYEPDHPDAGDNGYVAYPDIRLSEEMVDMVTASKGYEANLMAYQTTQSLLQMTMQLANV